MGKFGSYSNDSTSSSENWNDADGTIQMLRGYNFSEKEARDIARYGYAYFEDELVNFNVPTEDLKLKALERFRQSQLDCNLDFATFIREEDKIEMKKINETLINTRKKLVEGIAYRVSNNNVSGSSTKNLLPAFDVILNNLSELRSRRLRIYKKAGLLMPTKEHKDPSKAITEMH